MCLDAVSIGNFSESWLNVIMIPIIYSLLVLLIIWYKNQHARYEYSKGGWELTTWHIDVIIAVGAAVYYMVDRGHIHLPESSKWSNTIKSSELFLIVAISIVFPIIDAIRLRKEHQKEDDHS